MKVQADACASCIYKINKKGVNNLTPFLFILLNKLRSYVIVLATYKNMNIKKRRAFKWLTVIEFIYP